MGKIAKFVCILIIFLSLFLFEITVGGRYTTPWCVRDIDCPKEKCKHPFKPRCLTHSCVCRLWGSQDVI
ncbi:putative Late nodulin [Medicago truncatula]|uniref:Nodule Cysteine-Rich (NCR) secreted peptide n=1 Tax=Medicago truncatula TaxID=3880 RepID=A0A072UWG7_MEDTR|nr:Nodule Cysteine-Rich (NCR) secreted peptide [Medicago truncatula]RHN66687.1 putative Late nodulin [Medicago truncatula]